jgi:hypothetical protein
MSDIAIIKIVEAILIVGRFQDEVAALGFQARPVHTTRPKQGQLRVACRDAGM